MKTAHTQYKLIILNSIITFIIFYTIERMANMRLSPIPPRMKSYKKKTVTWSDSQQKSVTKLLSEASALINIFDQLSIILGPELKLKFNDSLENDSEEIKIPPSKWDPILTESCKLLQEKIKDFNRR